MNGIMERHLKDFIGKEDEVNKDDKGDYLMQKEFQKALKYLRDRKVIDVYDIPAELIKTTGNNIKIVLLKLITSV